LPKLASSFIVNVDIFLKIIPFTKSKILSGLS
jgi:hypothetical protein